MHCIKINCLKKKKQCMNSIVLIPRTGFSSDTSHPRYSATDIIWFTMQSISWKISKYIFTQMKMYHDSKNISNAFNENHTVPNHTYYFFITKEWLVLNWRFIVHLSNYANFVHMTSGFLAKTPTISRNHAVQTQNMIYPFQVGDMCENRKNQLV